MIHSFACAHDSLLLSSFRLVFLMCRRRPGWHWTGRRRRIREGVSRRQLTRQQRRARRGSQLVGRMDKTVRRIDDAHRASNGSCGCFACAVAGVRRAIASRCARRALHGQLGAKHKWIAGEDTQDTGRVRGKMTWTRSQLRVTVFRRLGECVPTLCASLSSHLFSFSSS